MNIGTPELLVIFAIALVVFGPQRLPDLMRQAARLWRQVKNFSDEMQGEFRSALRELESEEQPPRQPTDHPPGYDPATHSVPYVPPDIPHMLGATPEPAPIEPLAEAEPVAEAEVATEIVSEEVR